MSSFAKKLLAMNFRMINCPNSVLSLLRLALIMTHWIKEDPFPLEYEEFDEINYFTGENYFTEETSWIIIFKLFIYLLVYQKCEMISLHQK